MVKIRSLTCKYRKFQTAGAMSIRGMLVMFFVVRTPCIAFLTPISLYNAAETSTGISAIQSSGS